MAIIYSAIPVSSINATYPVPAGIAIVKHNIRMEKNDSYATRFPHP